MANIQKLKDYQEVDIYPLTHERAVIDSNGVNLESNLGELGRNMVDSTGVQEELELKRYSINSAGTFGTNQLYRHAVLPVTPGSVYSIYFTSKAGTYYGSYAFATTDECESGGDIPFAQGTTLITTTSVGKPIRVVIPEGCSYLLMSATNNSGEFGPVCYKMVDISKLEAEIETAGQDITRLDESVTSIEHEVGIGEITTDIKPDGFYPLSYSIRRDGSEWNDDALHKHIIISVKSGETFDITDNGYGTNYAFLTSDVATPLEVPPYVEGTSRMQFEPGETIRIKIPETCEYLYIYSGRAENGSSGTQALPSKIIRYLSTQDSDAEITSIIRKVSGGLPLSWSTKLVVDATTGEFTLNSSGNRAYSNLVNVSGLTKIRYSRPVSTVSSPTWGMAFYDQSRTFISGQEAVGGGESVGYVDTYLDVPSTAVFARFTRWQDRSVGDFYAVDANSLSESEVDGGENPFKGKKMIVTGASTDYGSTVSNPYTHSYGYLASQALGMQYVNYAIGGTCWSKGSNDDYEDVFFSYSDFQSATKDTTKRYLVKDGIIGDVRPWHIYRYVNGSWSTIGTTSTDNGRTPLVDRLPEMDTDADVIIVGGSAGNDWSYRGDYFGEEYLYDGDGAEQDADTAKLTVIGSLHLMCRYLMRTYPGKLVLFIKFGAAWRYQPRGISNITWNCTEPNVQNPYGYSYSEYAEAIEKVVKQYGYRFYSLSDYLGFTPYNGSWWCGDTDGKFVHPNLTGHKLGAKALTAYLLSLMH